MRSEDRLAGLDGANVNLSDFIAAMVSAAPGSSFTGSKLT